MRSYRRRRNAHTSFRNGSNCDDRAMRRCRLCGGIQYDWGCGMATSPKMRRRGLTEVMAWYCTGRGGCGLMQHEYMTQARLYDLRQNPPKMKRAPGAPWI